MNQTEQMREALRELKRHERVRTFAEAKYWLNQYKLFAEEALAAEPTPSVAVNEIYSEALEKIATVNAMDYEYQRWAKAAIAAAEAAKKGGV